MGLRLPQQTTTKDLDLNVPLNHLRERLAGNPCGRSIAVHYAGGCRSHNAARILNQNGITQRMEMAGGVADWEAASLKLAPAAP